MQYRDFGRAGWKVSALGFGCMRLPTLDGKPYGSKIDQAESAKMIRHAIDKGVNYIDTAYGYHGGKSEVLLGKTLKGEYRDKAKVATKCPVWLMKKASDFDSHLDKQLRRLQRDSVDFYLFHSMNRKAWRGYVLKLKLLKRAEAALKDGRIKHLGFSFHDDFDAFKEIIDGYSGWSMCQIQYNYMDTENQAGTKGLKYAASKGLAVVIMEPLLGGKLANPPKPIRKIYRERGRRVAPADLALQWLWDQPEVSVVLSGMSTMAQVRGNLRSANASGIGTLGAERRELVRRIKKQYRKMVPVPCTKCGYCMPCPNGLDIPHNFEEYNDAFIHQDLKNARWGYENFFEKKKRAESCIGCRECEEKCPQKIPIGDMMKKVHAVLGEGKPF